MRNKRIFYTLLLIGLAMINYPFISNFFNRMSDEEVIFSYQETVDNISSEQIDQILAEANQYNEALLNRQLQLQDGFSASYDQDVAYEKALNPGGDGLIGYISIPGIDEMLPIYHGTSSKVLDKGVGHLYGSSLPTGEVDSHVVLSAHSGLTNRTLFTFLDQLKEGDKFYLYILDEVFAYQITGSEVVEPDDTSSLNIVSGEDLVTLVTCTPYGVNTHRLLVHGTRVAYVPGEEVQEENRIGFRDFLQWIGVLLLAFVSLVLLATFFPRKKSKE